jgi:thiol-disulfide isomerase/thioredoxin
MRINRLLAMALLAASSPVLADRPLAEAARQGPAIVRRPQLVGAPAPKIEVLTWYNHPSSPLGMRGRVTLLDFWGTGCGVCVASLPKVEDLARRLGRSTQVVLIHDRLGTKIRTDSHGELLGEMVPADEVLPTFIRDRRVILPVAVTDTLTFRRYTAMVVPLYVVIDSDGVVRYAEDHLPPAEFLASLGQE